MENKDIVITRLDNDKRGWRFYDIFNTPKRYEDSDPNYTFPSSTTILGETVPKGNFLIKWIRETGIGGQAIFEQAAEDGTEVHIAIENLLEGQSIHTEDMGPKVKRCIQAFIDWYNEFQPITIATEQIVYNVEHGYAGGCDYICELDYEKSDKIHYKGTYVIDWKTSTAVHDSHLYQVASYWKALEGDKKDYKAAIVHLGNNTKAGFSFKEFDVAENWKLFDHFNRTFRLLHPVIKPEIPVYPDVFTLNNK